MGELNMKAVLRQTGLSADNLRAWEKRYGAVKPSRSPTGRRVYTDAEVHRLRLLCELVRMGHTIGKIANLSDENLVSRLNQSKSEKNSAQHSRVDEESTANLEALMKSVDQFDLAAVRSSLARLRYLNSPRRFAFELIPQVMFLIGKRIESGKISISQEHALSEIMRGHMNQIYDGLSTEDGTMKPVEALIFCTREGDPHDFGLMMAAIACRYRGYKTQYIGKNLPAESLVEATKKIKPTAIVMGVSALPESEDKIAPMDYVKAIDQKVSPGIEIWAGGSAARQLRKPSDRRDFWIFESIQDLETKLDLLKSKGAKS
ncbi:MAG: MerR family transcriptional regulator [Bdellovibrionales bacterium]|nr:MerR family transcriptional regulator [Bdellovibrionales bacterium]